MSREARGPAFAISLAVFLVAALARYIRFLFLPTYSHREIIGINFKHGIPGNEALGQFRNSNLRNKH